MKYHDPQLLPQLLPPKQGFWLRLKLWLQLAHWHRDRGGILDPREFNDHLRRDIGLSEPIQSVNWKALRENGWTDTIRM